MKPYSQACENNKQVILEQLQRFIDSGTTVLEIGSGTGQHAVHFGAAMPDIHWQTSDLAVNHNGINAWLNEAQLENVLPPLELDLTESSWSVVKADAIYTANTLHIVAWPQVVALFEGVAKILASGGVFCVYGPFNYGGNFTSDSNRQFDAHLKSRDPASGIRDFEKVHALAEEANLVLLDDVAMPANNRFLAYRKI